MTFLLNLIPQYRSLIETVRTLSEEKLRLQDRLDAAIEERDRIWKRYDGERQMTEAARDKAEVAYKTQINILSQQKLWFTPYEEAPHLPETSVHRSTTEPIGQRLLPSQAQAKLTAQFIDTLVSRKG